MQPGEHILTNATCAKNIYKYILRISNTSQILYVQNLSCDMQNCQYGVEVQDSNFILALSWIFA
jgi:hypothetical protein